MRILTSPVPPAGPRRLAHLSLLVSADAVRRWAVARGEAVEWLATTLWGGLAAQHEVERRLAREGHDRVSLGHDEFVARARLVAEEGALELQHLLGALGVEVDLEPGDAPALEVAAATAFVRLFDAGLVELAERVVPTCPRCVTVVQAADAVLGERTDQVPIVAAMTTSGVGIEFALPAPELLVGTVAVVVPKGHAAAGDKVQLPLTDAEVPVIGASVDETRTVVPAHDPEDFDLARRAGLPAPVVIDAEGVVTAAGPLQGLTRFAARAAARDLLAAEVVVVRTDERPIEVPTCRRCATALVPRLGRHWFLRMQRLEIAAADAVRQGTLAISPPAAAERFLERAGRGDDWCLSHQLWTGQPVPASRCAECGSVEVSVTRDDRCRRCMGDLVASGDVLDAWFVGAVSALASAGWPHRPGPAVAAAADTLLAVSPAGVVRWALPMTAIALRLTGHIPFRGVAVQELVADEADPDPLAPADVLRAIELAGQEVVRLSLVLGGADIAGLTDVAAAIGDPPVGDADVSALAAQCEAAYLAATPAHAATALCAAATAGVPPTARAAFARLVAPILGRDA